jgi:hypothetical protein
VVDPRFEGRGNGKVVHRTGKDDFIGFENFRNQLVGERQRTLMTFVVLLWRSECAGNPIEVDKRKRSLRQIALDHPAAWIPFLPRLDGGIAELA